MHLGFAAVFLYLVPLTLPLHPQSLPPLIPDHDRSATTLDSLRDRFRPLLIFAPSDTYPQLVEQARLIGEGLKELQDRQVQLVLVSPKDQGSWSVRIAPAAVYLQPPEGVRVRKRFHVGEGDFTVVLIGKDGGEKFRTHVPVTIERLKTVIDAMPMRQQEERNGRAK